MTGGAAALVREARALAAEADALREANAALLASLWDARRQIAQRDAEIAALRQLQLTSPGAAGGLDRTLHTADALGVLMTHLRSGQGAGASSDDLETAAEPETETEPETTEPEPETTEPDPDPDPETAERDSFFSLDRSSFSNESSGYSTAASSSGSSMGPAGGGARRRRRSRLSFVSLFRRPSAIEDDVAAAADKALLAVAPEHEVPHADRAGAAIQKAIAAVSDESARRGELAHRMGKMSAHKLLVSGADFFKYHSVGPRRRRRVWLTPDLQRVCWGRCNECSAMSTRDDKAKGSLLLADVVEARRGLVQCNAIAAKPDHCFTVVANQRVLALEAVDNQTRDLWMSVMHVMATDEEFRTPERDSVAERGSMF